MNTAIHIAETPAEREAIYKLRYQIYVEEMHIFGSVANHDEQLFIEETDAHARLIYATVNGEIVGSLRLNLGVDAPFSEEFEETYNLHLFRDNVSDDQLMVLTRFMVKEEYRGSAIAFRMIAEAGKVAIQHNIQVAVCDCQPHLIRYYNRMGFRSYACDIYNDPEFGIMIPLALVLPDQGYLKAIRSPLKSMLTPLADQSLGDALAACLGAPRVDTLGDRPSQGDEGVLETLLRRHENAEVAFFEGLSAVEVESLVRSGYIINCQPGDRVIRKGQLTNTVFVLLAGELHIEDAQGRTVARAHVGDVVGEMAYLLGARRSADVLAGSEGARLLILDERQLNRELSPASPTAPTLFKNLSRTLADKLARMLMNIEGAQVAGAV